MDFTSDWHSMHIPIWQEHLGEFDGRPVRCLEIGSHEGRSAVWIAQHLLSHPSATLTCIDPWPNPAAEQRFDTNIAETGRAPQVRKLKVTSWQGLPTLTPGFDLIYIDGNHEGRHVLEDAILSMRLLKVGGVLIFDDYPYQPVGVAQPPQPAIDAFLLLWSDCLSVLHREAQVIVRKIADPQRPPQVL